MRVGQVSPGADCCFGCGHLDVGQGCGAVTFLLGFLWSGNHGLAGVGVDGSVTFHGGTVGLKVFYCERMG